MNAKQETLDLVSLPGGHTVYTGMLPEDVSLAPAAFERLWDLHPETSDRILMWGKPVKLPRWKQAFDRNYYFSGVTSVAKPLPEFLQPLREWARANVDGRLNGVLASWYDGKLGHHIGPHQDKTDELVPGSPIVTLSFGETRTMRVRRLKGTDVADFTLIDGSVFIIPWETNKSWKHQITKTKKAKGRRVSITIRAFR